MLGDRLKQFAFDKYGSITGLSEVTGIVQPQLSSYTSGKKKPSVDILLKLLNAGCNINWLISGMGNMSYSSDDNFLSTAIDISRLKETKTTNLTKNEIEDLRALLKASQKSKRAVG